MDRDAGTDLGKARALAVEINTYDIREWRQTDVPGDPEVVADAQDGGGAILSSAHSATGGLGLDLSGTGTQSAEEVEMSTREWVEPDDGTECTERLSDVAVASDPGVRRCAKEEPLAERASQCQHAGSATHSLVSAQLAISRAPAEAHSGPEAGAGSLQALSESQRRRGVRRYSSSSVGASCEARVVMAEPRWLLAALFPEPLRPRQRHVRDARPPCAAPGAWPIGSG